MKTRKPAPHLEGIFDRPHLRRLAGPRSFERGRDYFDAGRIVSLVEHEGTITAEVRGGRVYRVRLWAEDGTLAYSCTCPVGAEAEFCKHCVAVGLAWLADGEPRQRGAGPSPGGVATLDDIREYLARQSQDVLVDMLVEQAVEDDRLRQRLLLKAAAGSAKGVDLAAYRAAINGAVEAEGFIDYAEAYGYSRGIDEAVDGIEELLEAGRAAEVVELAEHALERVEDALEWIDDSDGNLGGILARLQDLHHAACRKAKPDPEALAGRLFAWELRTEWDTFLGAVETYAGVLGKKGLAAYRELAEAEWGRLRPVGPGEHDPHRYGKRFRITHIMELLARADGDLEALVAVMSRDLSYAYNYLRIAEVYKQAGRDEDALAWAERGVDAFPERTDSRLLEFLAEEYHRSGRHEDAMAVAWTAFTDSPTLARYRDLKSHADRADQWTTWREKAIDHLRQAVAGGKRTSGTGRWGSFHPADHSELVRILLWEQKPDTAWREAREGGCSAALWMELAAIRETEHPEDALPIYQARIEPTIQQKNNAAYREAVDLLEKVHGLMLRLGQSSEFVEYLGTLRAAHKRKRNLMKLLDKAEWARAPGPR